MSARGTPKPLVSIEDYPAGELHGEIRRECLHPWRVEYAEQGGIAPPCPDATPADDDIHTDVG